MRILPALAATVLLLAGCSTAPQEPTPPGSTSPTAAITTSATSSPTTSSPAPEEPTGQPADEAAQAGSGAGDYQCPGTGAYVSGPEQCAQDQQYAPQDLSTVAYADGGTCPAYKCGYGHDENGNRNPSSGEIQTKHGCDTGYITDPALCGAVNQRFGQ